MTRSAFLLTLLVASGARGVHAQPLPEAFPALPAFTQPIDIVAAPEAGRLWVAERDGTVWAFDEAPEADSREIVLDLRARIGPLAQDGGLQSVAVHPSGEWVAAYLVLRVGGAFESLVVRYAIRADGTADADSEREILRVPQPTGLHNGGKILWGPDGMLYVPLGDGGLAEGLSTNGQDRTTLLGSVLRLSVPLAPEATGYAIPADNPFVGNAQGWREEIWAWGVRNPWRSSFDASGRLWLADVGENDWEEVNLVASGDNLGWDEMEGPACAVASCEAFRSPVFVYPHDFATGGVSITGGFVYRGARAPGLAGRYVAADLITHRLWSLDAENPADVRDHGIVADNAWIVAFGEGGEGELYALSYSQGRVLDIGSWAATGTEVPPEAEPLALRVAPNPARSFSEVRWAPDGSPVWTGASRLARVDVIDALGRTVQTHAPLAQAGRQRLDLAALAPGVYAVRVALPEGTATARITVVR